MWASAGALEDLAVGRIASVWKRGNWFAVHDSVNAERLWDSHYG